ncbi:MAG: hypothetical protein JOZ54_17920 [Acidobacteria bacterium]|nr:hypothetical protein [Acidobacteriota bacterium]
MRRLLPFLLAALTAPAAFAAPLVTQAVVSHTYAPPPGVFAATAKAVSLVRTDAGVVGCWANAPQILCATLAPAGGFDTPVVLPSYTSGVAGSVPAVAWNGRELLVAFEEGENIALVRLDRSLRVLAPPKPLEFRASAGSAPALSWNRNEWLLTYRNYEAYIAATGAAMYAESDPWPVVDSGLSGDEVVVIHSPGTRTVAGPPSCHYIMYGFGCCTICNPTTVQEPEWHATSSVVGPVPLPLDRYTDARSAALAQRGNGALLVWPQIEFATSALLTASLDGNRLGATQRIGVTANGVLPRIAATPTNGLVVWEEAGDIRGVLVDADGKADGDPFVIAATAPVEAHPSVIAMNENEYVVAYEIEGKLATRFVILQQSKRRSR